MVKRIRKRVEKSEPDENAVDNEAPPEDGPRDFAQQMDALAEDRLTTVLAGWFKFVAQHKGLIIAGTLAIVAAWGALAYMDHSAEGDKAKSADSVYAAFETAQKAVEKDAEGKEPSADKRSAALKQALQDMQAARGNVEGQPIGTLALLSEASIQYDLGEFKSASESFAQVASADSATNLVKMVSLQGQAAAFEDAGDRTQAVKIWKDIEALDSEAFGLTARLQQGRLLEAEGAIADAKALYETTRTEYSTALGLPANVGLNAELAGREQRLKLRN